MSLDTIHADDIEEGLQRWASNPGPDPGTSFHTVGFLGAGLKAIPAAAFDVAAAGADAASGLTSSLLATGGGEGFSLPGQQDQSAKLDFDTAGGNALRTRADEFSPDPLTAHAADQVLHGLVRFGTKAGLAVGTMGPFGALLLGAEETENETQRLRAQGVDTGTAVKVGAVQGVASAVGAVMPLGGKTILQTLGLVAAGGPGMFMGQEALSKKILQSAGQNDQASLHNPFDPLGLAVSTVIPGAFGALHVRSVQRTALERVVEHIESGGQRYGKDGELLTSPKGAQGEMQVMPGTATDPGFGVTPAQNNSPEELARVGRDYLGAMANRYRDSDKALAAYNAGPGAVDKAVAAHGDDWLKHLPRETQEYVHKANALGARHAGEVAAQDAANVDAARTATTNDALTRGLPDTPDAVGQVQRAADIVAEDGGRAAEQIVPKLVEAQLMDTRGQGLRFHGSSREIDALSDDYAMVGDNRNIYGAGFYTTDAADVSAGYMKKGRGGQPTLYLVDESPARLFDMETPLTPDIHEVVKRAMGDLLPTENAETGKPLTNLRQIYDEFRAESKNNGLSRDDVQEVFDSVRYNLEQQGYRGFRHTGGDKTGIAPHEVKIFWNPEQDVKISKASLDEFRQGQDRLESAPPIVHADNALPPHDSITLAGDEPTPRGEELGSAQREAASQKADAGKPISTAKDPEARARDVELLQKRRTTLQTLLDCLEVA